MIMKKAILLLHTDLNDTDEFSKTFELHLNGKITHINNKSKLNPESNRFYYSDCDKDTKYIFVSGIKSLYELIEYFYNIDDGVLVKKKYQDQFIIHPQFIFGIKGYNLLNKENNILREIKLMSREFKVRFLVVIV